MKRATIADLSREAGVSVATVDRVLNGRLKVREETARKVHEAARRIGYHGANAIHSRILADLPELHFGIILQKGGHAFYRGVRRRDRGPAPGPHTSSPAWDDALSSRAPAPVNLPSCSHRWRARCRRSRRPGSTTTRSPAPWRPARARHPDVLAAFRLCPRRSRKLRRAEQSQGRTRGRMADVPHGPAAGQGRHVRRRAPLPRPRAAGDGPAQLLPRIRPRPRVAERRCSIWRSARSPTRPRTRSSRSIRTSRASTAWAAAWRGLSRRSGSRGARMR